MTRASTHVTGLDDGRWGLCQFDSVGGGHGVGQRVWLYGRWELGRKKKGGTKRGDGERGVRGGRHTEVIERLGSWVDRKVEE